LKALLSKAFKNLSNDSSGLFKLGLERGFAKQTLSQVQEIKSLYKQGF